MFERYTEGARRALFFARYEVSQSGGVTIDAEHLLIGLIREPTRTTSLIAAHTGVSAALNGTSTDVAAFGPAPNTRTPTP